MNCIGFKEAKRRLLAALDSGNYQHEARSGIVTKNLLQTGQVSAQTLAALVLRCSGQHHSSSPHHLIGSVEVHVFRRDGWYVKFYFIDPDTIFISVHKSGQP